MTIPFSLIACNEPKDELCLPIWQQGDTLFIHEVSEDQRIHFPKNSVEKVVSLDFGFDVAKPLYSYCYALPLIDVEGHREYCRQAMNERRTQTEKACRSFNIASIHKWIQDDKWVLYYQLMTSPVEVCREALFMLQHDTNAHIATKMLRETTGCTFTELCPKTYIRNVR